MCKEDIRLARKAYTKQVVNLTGITAPTKLLNANPNRYSLLGAMIATASPSASSIPMIAALIGGMYYPLIVQGGASGGDIVPIQRAGQAITAEIWFVPADNLNTYSVYCGETEFQETLERL